MKARDLIIIGDALKVLKTFPDDVIDCCITSPPYWGLRNYNVEGQIGLESTLGEYIDRLAQVFHEVKRVLKPEGTLFLNMGDKHNSGKFIEKSLKPKDLLGQSWRLALALQADGWWLRSAIVWHKKNPMPESAKDRPTKTYEFVFLMTKKARYFYDAEAIREPHNPDNRKITKVVGKSGSIQHRDGERWPGTGRNKRDVWSIATQPFPEAHFATFPEKLVEPCILAGTSEKGYCSKCGKPWVRVIKKGKLKNIGHTNLKSSSTGVDYKAQETQASHRTREGHISNWASERKQVGWKASCNCKANTVPGIVLDPFMGSGTVALVAKRLGRDYLGIELSMDYLKMVRRRLFKQLGIKARAVDRR